MHIGKPYIIIKLFAELAGVRDVGTNIGIYFSRKKICTYIIIYQPISACHSKYMNSRR